MRKPSAFSRILENKAQNSNAGKIDKQWYYMKVKIRKGYKVGNNNPAQLYLTLIVLN